jgi:hypothetical protein
MVSFENIMQISIASRFKTAVLVFLLFVTFVFSIDVQAQTESSAGVSITPGLIEKPADPGQQLVEEFKVTNLSSQEQTYYLMVRDISGVKDGGAPIYADENAEKTGYEMSEWVQLGMTEVTLAPKQEQAIPVTINVPASATPGSHFGGIFVSLEPPRMRTIGATVGFDVANILSIRISGDALESLQIRSFATDKYVYGSPEVQFKAKLQNKGNVLARPYGPLVVTNMFGKEVANMTFNEQLGGVFPQTTRDFQMAWTDRGTAFGRYEARLSLVYGEDGNQLNTVSSVISFWVLPWNIIKPALIVLFVLLVATYFAIRFYIQRKMQVLTQGRVISRRRARGGNSPVMLVFVVMLTVTALFLLLLLILFA